MQMPTGNLIFRSEIEILSSPNEKDYHKNTDCVCAPKFSK